jgi:CRP-like cAMP-binding protein
MAVLDMLRRADICSGLSDEELALVADISTMKDCGTGDIIFEEGSASDELYVIVNGEVDIIVGPDDYEANSGSTPLTIATLRRGQSFGEMALVSQGIRAATARCSQHDSSLMVIPRRHLMQLFEQYPTLGYKVMYNLAADLAEKIRMTDILIQERVTWSGMR